MEKVGQNTRSCQNVSEQLVENLNPDWRSVEILRGVLISKATNFKANDKAKLEFPKGWWVQAKTLLNYYVKTPTL